MDGHLHKEKGGQIDEWMARDVEIKKGEWMDKDVVSKGQIEGRMGSAREEWVRGIQAVSYR